MVLYNFNSNCLGYLHGYKQHTGPPLSNRCNNSTTRPLLPRGLHVKDHFFDTGYKPFVKILLHALTFSISFKYNSDSFRQAQLEHNSKNLQVRVRNNPRVYAILYTAEHPSSMTMFLQRYCVLPQGCYKMFCEVWKQQRVTKCLLFVVVIQVQIVHSFDSLSCSETQQFTVICILKYCLFLTTFLGEFPQKTTYLSEILTSNLTFIYVL